MIPIPLRGNVARCKTAFKKSEVSLGTQVWSSGVPPRSKVFTQENQFSCNENFERSNGEHSE